MSNELQKPETIELTQDEQIRLAIREQLEKTNKGSIKNSMGNCELIFTHDPMFCDGIRYNLLTNRVDIVKTMPWHREGSILNDIDFDHIMLHMDTEYGIQSEKMIRHTLSTVANKHRFHPIRDYLNSLEWDGTPRVRFALHRFLGAEVTDLNEEFLRVFMTGAVHRVFNPGCKFELMLCLVGGQGAGKSTFFRFLAIRDEWFTDDLRKLDDENVYRKLQGHWIIEMSEMIATASAKSIEEIKSFVSRQKETYKTPYAVYPEDKPRQCVFAGTTNRSDFMPKDRSGNRRFLPVRIDASQAEAHVLDDENATRDYIDQMWAEIMSAYKAGEGKLTLSSESAKQQNTLQKEFMQEDSNAGVILDFMENFGGTKVCSKQLWEEALMHHCEQLKPWDLREICDIVNSAIDAGELTGWRAFTNPRHFGKYGKQRGWEKIAEDSIQEWQHGNGNRAQLEQMGFIPVDPPDDFPF